MLARAAVSVAGAEKLRASTRPLEDEGVRRLVREARRRLAMTRRIRLAVTEKLTSPAVVGVVVPTLILPLSLLTTIPARQLQLILLHELAHIRRGDYLANLFQFVIESVLFFNPAVWWLSRQMRLEREACCDALAAGLAEDRLEYARALACVAEQALGPAPVAAPAFADRRQPSALRDRLERLLVPGYRPSLRLTWKALVGSLFLGGALLLLSAVGTQWTVKAAAKLLSPQQRIERIENAMKNLGQPPADSATQEAQQIPAKVVVRTRDGSPLPSGTYGTFISRRRNSSTGIGVTPDKDGVCAASVPRGELFFYANVQEGFAPAFLGPIDTRASNEVENLELILEPGFPVSIKAMDADSGQPLPEATLNCQFWVPQAGQGLGNPQPLATDRQGLATLPHCAPLPLGITLIKPGYETVEQRFAPPKPNATLSLSTLRALPMAGQVTDQTTKEPVSEAEIYVLRAEDAPGVQDHHPDHPGSPLAVTDARGQFVINQLPRGGRYWLLVRADGHADAILANAQAGQTNLHAALGPELRVTGRISGDLSLLPRSNQGPRLACRNQYQEGNFTYETFKYVPVRIEGETGYFEFVSPIAGLLKLEAGDRTFRRDVTAPVKDWVLDLSPATNEPPPRSITLRFEHPFESPAQRHHLR